MTTVIANAKGIYADSQIVGDGLPYLATKLTRIGSAVVGFAGDVEAAKKFMEWYPRRNTEPQPKYGEDADFDALVLDCTGLYLWSNKFGPDRILSKYHSIGTGATIALTAMHLGKTPCEALEVVCKLDPNSSKPIQIELIGK